jgi:hypothetical protein
MLRTTVGLSFLVLFGVASACSSKSTDNNTTGGTGGNGAVLGGSSTGGTGTAVGGVVGRAGTTATGGSAVGNGLCPGDTITCVDDMTATYCDPDTGIEENFNCADDAKNIGFVSSGCTMGTGLTADKCAIDSVADDKCFAGAQGYVFCAGLTTDEDLFNVYVNCFQDYMGVKTMVQCIGDYVSQTMTADSDCLAAQDACLGGGVGGAGAGGASDGAGGAQ